MTSSLSNCKKTKWGACHIWAIHYFHSKLSHGIPNLRRRKLQMGKQLAMGEINYGFCTQLPRWGQMTKEATIIYIVKGTVKKCC